MFRLLTQNLLRTALMADGIFSLAAGTGLAGFAGPVAGLAGPGVTPFMVQILGAGLVAWGIFHILMARQPHPARTAVRIAITGDLLWVVASIGLLIGARDAFSAAGLAVVIVAMIGVADFMALKMKGLSQQSARAA